MDRGRGGGRQASRERSRGIYDGERYIYIYIYNLLGKDLVGPTRV